MEVAQLRISRKGLAKLASGSMGESADVLRRKGESVFVRIMEFGVLLNPVILSLVVPPTFAVLDFVVLSLCVGAISWLLGSMSNTRVSVGAAGISVVNVLVRWWIPWSAVASVDADNEVTIALVDGRVIRPSIGAGSGMDVLRGNRYQKNIARTILSRRPPVPMASDSTVTMGLNKYPWLFVLPACFLVAFTVTTCLVRH